MFGQSGSLSEDVKTHQFECVELAAISEATTVAQVEQIRQRIVPSVSVTAAVVDRVHVEVRGPDL